MAYGRLYEMRRKPIGKTLKTSKIHGRSPWKMSVTVGYGVLRVKGDVDFCFRHYGGLRWVTLPHMGHRKTHVTNRPFADVCCEMLPSVRKLV